MKKVFTLSKIDKLKLSGMLIKAITGVIGASLILSENHPYLTLIILSIGAAANEWVSFIQNKENDLNSNNNEKL